MLVEAWVSLAEICRLELKELARTGSRGLWRLECCQNCFVKNVFQSFLQLEWRGREEKKIMSLVQACFFTDFAAIQDNGISLIMSLEKKSLSLGRKFLSLRKSST